MTPDPEVWMEIYRAMEEMQRIHLMCKEAVRLVPGAERDIAAIERAGEAAVLAELQRWLHQGPS
jgi:urease beta subunit